MRFLLIGHSHSWSIFHACREALSQHSLAGVHHINLHDKRYHPFIDQESGELNPTIRSEIEQWLSASPDQTADHFLLSINGNEHNSIGLVRNPIPFDFHLPGNDGSSLLPEAQLIPHEAMVKFMEARLNAPPERNLPAFKLGDELAKLFPKAPIWLEPPPPIGDPDYILANPQGYEQPLAERGVGPASVSLKLWQLQTAITRKRCAERGWGYVPSPVRCHTPEGFLAPEARRPDPTHGNKFYGQVFFDSIISFLQAHAK